MPVTKAERNYLKRKHQGGRNNSKGASYESFYAVYCIASLMERYMQRLDDVCLSSQVEACFVDDLLVAGPDGKRIYHQLKDVKGLTWKAGRLKSDFTRQMDLGPGEVDCQYVMRREDPADEADDRHSAAEGIYCGSGDV